MIKCELCGKEFKTGQGLSGHMKFVHGVSGGSGKPVTQLVTGEQLHQLEGDIEVLGEQLSNHTQQLHQLNGYPKQANDFGQQLNQLTKRLDEVVKQGNALTAWAERVRDELPAFRGDILALKGRVGFTQSPGGETIEASNPEPEPEPEFEFGSFIRRSKES
ncbi:hypothetical protein ES705_36316 [subsurface metagenome]